MLHFAEIAGVLAYFLLSLFLSPSKLAPCSLPIQALSAEGAAHD
jgi:hypothetical protein